MFEQSEKCEVLSNLAEAAEGIDHIAVAVPNLEKSIAWYRDVLGFQVKETRETLGRATAMTSAVLRAGPITVVLIQGTTSESQVTRYIDHYGPGVQHIAFSVKDLGKLADRLKRSGVEFDTTLIEGQGIRQIFTKRDPDSGMMYEFIERTEEDGRFTDESVQQLFEQLEANDSF